MVTAPRQAGRWAVEGEQLFSSAAFVFLALWGCKVGCGMPLVSKIPKRELVLYALALFSCGLWCSPSSCTAVAVNGCFSCSVKKPMQLCGISKLVHAAM